MKGTLVRVGIDQTYGHWNAPVDPVSCQFVYVPIPEDPDVQMHPGLGRSFTQVLPALDGFCARHKCNVDYDLNFPYSLVGSYVHLDPDFGELTYGDVGNRRGAGIAKMRNGDLLAFYAGLRPIRECEHKLIYALVGLYVVDEVVLADDVPRARWSENAHTRRVKRGTMDIVVRAKQSVSGRLERCIPIGEWRNNAYRVRRSILDEWGGLSVKDGYIQRSAVPPSFIEPERFYRWFLNQEVRLCQRNN